MKINSKFASMLVRARSELDYTQSQVAEAVSVSVRWYQRVESGVKFPGSMTLLRLILFLHLDVEEFREEVGLLVPISPIRRNRVEQ